MDANYRNGSSTGTTSTTVYVTSGPQLASLDQQEFHILLPSFVLILVVLVLGVPGNIITMCVYSKKMRRTASRVFILALTLCDLVNCLLTMPLEIALIINFWTFDVPVFCSIGRTLTYTLNGISALLLVGIGIDRFRKICRPLKPVFTPNKTRSICLLSTFVGFCVYTPGYILYGTNTTLVHVSDGGRNITIVGKTCLIQDKYDDTRIMKLTIILWFFLTVFVMVVLIIIYIFIGRAVYKQLKLEEIRRNSLPSSKRSKLRQIMAERSSETSCSYDDCLSDNKSGRKSLGRMTENNRNKLGQSLKNAYKFSKHPTASSLKQAQLSNRIKPGRTTLMLFMVTIAYILSYIPFCIIVAIRMANPQLYPSLAPVEKSIWNFFLRSYVINCAVNPLLYGFFNKDFRTKMVDLFKDWTFQ